MHERHYRELPEFTSGHDFLLNPLVTQWSSVLNKATANANVPNTGNSPNIHNTQSHDNLLRVLRHQQPTSLTSPTSPTSPTSLTSPTSPASSTSYMTPTSTFSSVAASPAPSSTTSTGYITHTNMIHDVLMKIQQQQQQQQTDLQGFYLRTIKTTMMTNPATRRFTELTLPTKIDQAACCFYVVLQQKLGKTPLLDLGSIQLMIDIIHMLVRIVMDEYCESQGSEVPKQVSMWLRIIVHVVVNSDIVSDANGVPVKILYRKTMSEAVADGSFARTIQRVFDVVNNEMFADCSHLMATLSQPTFPPQQTQQQPTTYMTNFARMFVKTTFMQGDHKGVHAQYSFACGFLNAFISNDYTKIPKLKGMEVFWLNGRQAAFDVMKDPSNDAHVQTCIEYNMAIVSEWRDLAATQRRGSAAE